MLLPFKLQTQQHLHYYPTRSIPNSFCTFIHLLYLAREDAVSTWSQSLSYCQSLLNHFHLTFYYRFARLNAPYIHSWTALNSPFTAIYHQMSSWEVVQSLVPFLLPRPRPSCCTDHHPRWHRLSFSNHIYRLHTFITQNAFVNIALCHRGGMPRLNFLCRRSHKHCILLYAYGWTHQCANHDVFRVLFGFKAYDQPWSIWFPVTRQLPKNLLHPGELCNGIGQRHRLLVWRYSTFPVLESRWWPV